MSGAILIYRLCGQRSRVTLCFIFVLYLILIKHFGSEYCDSGWSLSRADWSCGWCRLSSLYLLVICLYKHPLTCVSVYLWPSTYLGCCLNDNLTFVVKVKQESESMPNGGDRWRFQITLNVTPDREWVYYSLTDFFITVFYMKLCHCSFIVYWFLLLFPMGECSTFHKKFCIVIMYAGSRGIM